MLVGLLQAKWQKNKGILPWGPVLLQGPGQGCDVNEVGVNVKSHSEIWLDNHRARLGSQRP